MLLDIGQHHGRLGGDIVFAEETLDIGRKLINKIWNVSSFINMQLEDFEDKEFTDFEYMDKWILGKYEEMQKQYIKYLDEYEIGLALNVLEKFFWNFCDNYIEIVKHRLYRPEEFSEKGRYSGQKTICVLLKKLLQVFSIYFPFITEEIYSETFKTNDSIHNTELEHLKYNFTGETMAGDEIVKIISDVRGEKTKHNVSLKTEVTTFDIDINEKYKDYVETAMKDIKATLNITSIDCDFKDIPSYHIEKIELSTGA